MIENKAAYIHKLFSSIADCYNFLNIVISFNRIKGWRRLAASKAELKSGGIGLDVATGTGELALEMAKYGRVVGVDFCEGMLSKAEKKRADNVHFALAMAESLPFPDNVFDCATIAFALRNVSDVKKVLQEMVRVVKVGGKVICLETCQPSNRLFHRIYRFYLFYILPLIGVLISRKKCAYTYLPHSIVEFFTPQGVKQIMEESGLGDIQIYSLTLGIATICVGRKNK